MKHDIVQFVAKCVECQQVKADHCHPAGLLQPHDIPMTKWEIISMDFISGLPLTSQRHNAILVVVDKLTKSAHFIPSALGTQLNLSIAYHPETDGKTERVNQVLEDMLRMYVMDQQSHWEKYLSLVEFAYNNSYHSSIGMPPFEALYGRPYRTPLSWDKLEDRVIIGLELIQEMEEQVRQIRQRLKETQDRQKSYADAHRTDRKYEAGDEVFIRIKPNKSTIRFGKGTKLSPQFIGPFKAMERVGPVAYRLALPPHLHKIHNVFHVSVLRHYIADQSHNLQWKELQVSNEGIISVEPLGVTRGLSGGLLVEERPPPRTQIKPLSRILGGSGEEGKEGRKGKLEEEEHHKRKFSTGRA
eukprot:PITA_31488